MSVGRIFLSLPLRQRNEPSTLIFTNDGSFLFDPVSMKTLEARAILRFISSQASEPKLTSISEIRGPHSTIPPTAIRHRIQIANFACGIETLPQPFLTFNNFGSSFFIFTFEITVYSLFLIIMILIFMIIIIIITSV